MSTYELNFLLLLMMMTMILQLHPLKSTSEEYLLVCEKKKHCNSSNNNNRSQHVLKACIQQHYTYNASLLNYRNTLIETVRRYN